MNLVQPIAVENAHAFGQGHALVFFGFVGHHHNALGAFGPHAHGDLQHAVALGPLAHGLAAGHGHRVVVQNFVGDVHASRNALANRQNAAVKISAIAQVGKNMVLVAERLLAGPWHAFAAHLREANGAAVHPNAHEMATNAGHRTRALGHLGRGVVRTTRAKPRLPIAAGPQRERLHGLFFGLKHRQMGVDLRSGVGIDADFFEPFGNGARNDGGRQIGIGPQQCALGRVGHRPFAARHVTLGLVEFAQDVRAHIVAPVVQLFFELVFDDLALFLDHQDLAQAGGERACRLRLEWPDHRHFVQANAQLSATGLVQPQVQQGLARVVVGLATGDQTKAVVRAFDHVLVEFVGPDVGQCRIPFVIKQTRLLLQRGVGPPDVHAAGRHHKLGQHNAHPFGVDLRGGTGLHDLLNGLHA